MNLHDIRHLIGQDNTAIKALISRVQEGAGHSKCQRDELMKKIET